MHHRHCKKIKRSKGQQMQDSVQTNPYHTSTCCIATASKPYSATIAIPPYTVGEVPTVSFKAKVSISLYIWGQWLKECLLSFKVKNEFLYTRQGVWNHSSREVLLKFQGKTNFPTRPSDWGISRVLKSWEAFLQGWWSLSTSQPTQNAPGNFRQC